MNATRTTAATVKTVAAAAAAAATTTAKIVATKPTTTTAAKAIATDGTDSAAQPGRIRRDGLRLKNVVVTGGGGNIGLAIAKRFAEEGANVVLAGRTLQKLERALAELQALHPSPMVNKTRSHSKFQMDVREALEWNRLVEQHDKIDVLVNCAGEAQRTLLFRTDVAAVNSLLDINLRSVIYGSKTVGQQMVRRRDGGCIINVSSLLAIRSELGTSVYAAAKAGQIGFTNALARELGRFNIRVNAILPGYVRGDMIGSMDEDRKEEILKWIPLQRFGIPDEVADAAAFLAKNQYANNCVVNLDGGLSAI